MRKLGIAVLVVALAVTPVVSIAAIGGGKFGNGSSTGTTAVKVSTIVGTTTVGSATYVAIMIQCQSGTLYYGPSTVTTAGANAYGYVPSGAAVSLPKADYDLGTMYVIGAGASDVGYVTAVTGTTTGP